MSPAVNQSIRLHSIDTIVKGGLGWVVREELLSAVMGYLQESTAYLLRGDYDILANEQREDDVMDL